MKYILLLALFTGFSFCSSALAMSADGMHGGNSTHKGNPMNQEYMKAMDSMHGDMMDGIMDPDPDTAFVRGMLPHHQGAVDMARIELKYGKDPELRKLAQDIIEAQEKEITFMQEWLKRKGLSR